MVYSTANFQMVRPGSRFGQLKMGVVNEMGVARKRVHLILLDCGGSND